MAKQFPELSEGHKTFIENQHLFFVGSAAPEGRVNLSPKGMDSLRVMDSNRVVWLNLTGSGNETAAHLLESNRMTIMMCSFDKQPLILRLYGTAKTIHSRDEEWAELSQHFPDYKGARQIYDMQIELVQTSCGFGIPFYSHQGSRDTLLKWADNKGREGVEAYQQQNNTTSIDGKQTGI